MQRQMRHGQGGVRATCVAQRNALCDGIYQALLLRVRKLLPAARRVRVSAQSERSAHDDVRSSDIGCDTCDASHSTAANGITSTVIPIRAVLQEEHVHAPTVKMRACVLHTLQQMCAVSWCSTGICNSTIPTHDALGPLAQMPEMAPPFG